jgi:hypothetical protein
MRIVIAGLLGGIVMFFWGFVAHTMLPLGEIGMKTLPIAKQDAVLAATRDALGEPGVYIVPGFEDMDDYGDDEKGKAFGERALANPYAFIVYQPQGSDMVNAMGPYLGKEFATNVLSALLAAFVVSFAAVGFGLRAVLVGVMGVFAWMTTHVPYWNWYRFPLDFTLASLAMEAIGWLLAGFAIAWWLGRGRTA